MLTIQNRDKLVGIELITANLDVWTIVKVSENNSNYKFYVELGGFSHLKVIELGRIAKQNSFYTLSNGGYQSLVSRENISDIKRFITELEIVIDN